MKRWLISIGITIFVAVLGITGYLYWHERQVNLAITANITETKRIEAEQKSLLDQQNKDNAVLANLVNSLSQEGLQIVTQNGTALIQKPQNTFLVVAQDKNGVNHLIEWVDGFILADRQLSVSNTP